MADISKITLPDSSEYNIKDAGALRIDGTAVRAGKLSNVHSISGTVEGWYKFLTISMATSTRQTMIIAIENRYSSEAGFLRIHTHINSYGTGFQTVGWIASGNLHPLVRWAYSGGTWTFYIYKSGGSTDILYFQCISRTDDSYGTWLSESVAEPTTATDASKYVDLNVERATNDGNGDQIDTTYLKKTAAAVEAKSLASSNSINGAYKWYDFLELPLQTFDIEILITETANNNAVGIFRAAYFTNGGYCKVNWMTYPPDYRRLCYEVASDKVIFYYYKGTGSGYTLQFKVLSSTVGSSVLDLTDYWKAVGQSSTDVTSPPANTITAGIYGHYWGVCNTAADTAAKTVTIPNFPIVIPDGTEIRVYFTTDQSATSPTLNVNNIGAYPIRVYVASSTAWNVPVDYWTSGDYVTLVFNATNSCWVVTGKSGKASTGNYGYTKLSSAIDSTATDLAATPSAVKQAYDLAAAALPASGILYYENQAVSVGSSAQIISITNNAISDNHVLARIEWADPQYITTGYSWTTEDGAFKLTGTCTAATTANIVLVRKGN